MSKDKLDKIDNCLFELLELVETFNEIRTKSNKELSSGYFNLAKSKYSLGAGTLTSLSYDKRMKSGATITIEKDNDKELIQYKLGGELYEKKNKPTEKKSEKELTLKNRNNEENAKEETTKTTTTTITADENEVKFNGFLTLAISLKDNKTLNHLTFSKDFFNTLSEVKAFTTQGKKLISTQEFILVSLSNILEAFVFRNR